MRKQLIIVLALAGLATTTACGSKDSYRGVKANLAEKKVLPPVVDASVEQQAMIIANKDSQFQSNRESFEAIALQESVKAVSMVVNTLGAGLDAQAEVTLFTTANSETCVPTLKKSIEFNSKDITEKGKFSVKGVGRVNCIDKACKNVVLFIEKQGGGFSEQESTIFGTVAILMSRDSDDRVYRPMSTESELFLQVESIEDRVAQCEKDKAEAASKQNLEGAGRKSEIEARMSVIQDEINKLNNGQIAMGEAARQARIALLNKEKTTLTTELNQLNGVAINDPAVTRIQGIDDKIKAIDKEIALHRDQKIFSDLNLSAARIAELEKEKKSLLNLKASL